MHRLAIALVLVAACSGKAKQAPTTAGSGSQAIYAKKTLLSWGIEPSGSAADVFLQLTDETGKQTSYPLGTYQGECKIVTPAPEMKAVGAVQCMTGGTGVELDAVVDGEHVIVLKGKVDVGVAPDPMAREEVTRVAAPPGSAVVLQ
ncbi:MAG: hypothetical protein ACM31C_25090 [Acidobacteriota bacterium]